MLAPRPIVGPVALAAALSLGCQAAMPPDVPLRTTSDLAGLAPAHDLETADRRVWLRPGGKSLADYSAFAVEPTEIRLESIDPELLTTDDQALLELELRRAVERELGKGGYALVGKAGEHVLDLELRITAIGALPPPTSSNAWLFGRRLRGATVAIEAEYRDSLTDRLEGVSVSRIRNEGGNARRGTLGRWGDVVAAFEQWAQRFRVFVDEARR